MTQASTRLRTAVSLSGFLWRSVFVARLVLACASTLQELRGRDRATTSVLVAAGCASHRLVQVSSSPHHVNLQARPPNGSKRPLGARNSEAKARYGQSDLHVLQPEGGHVGGRRWRHPGTSCICKLSKNQYRSGRSETSITTRSTDRYAADAGTGKIMS